MEELSRILLHDLPALVLVLFISRESLRAEPFARPSRGDAAYAAGAFGVLVMLSWTLGLAAATSSADLSEAYLEAPIGFFGWSTALISCLVTGYLEESYFRGYLLSKLEELGVSGPRTILVSVVLFALCHLYEGPWGLVNAAAAGTALSLLFLRRRTVHAAAWAHAAYNAFVYLTYL